MNRRYHPAILVALQTWADFGIGILAAAGWFKGLVAPRRRDRADRVNTVGSMVQFEIGGKAAFNHRTMLAIQYSEIAN